MAEESGRDISIWDDSDRCWAECRRFLRDCLIRLGYGFRPEEIEDLTQEAAYRAWVSTRRGPPNHAEGLMAAIARRTAVDHLRRKARLARRIRPLVSVDENIVDPRSSEPSEQFVGDLAPWLRFLAMEFFQQKHPGCVEVGKAYFDEKPWTVLEQELGKKANTLAQNWARCRKKFIEALLSSGTRWKLPPSGEA